MLFTSAIPLWPADVSIGKVDLCIKSFTVDDHISSAMTSIDDLFKKPGLPNGNKRKFEPVRDPNEVYKSVKHTTNGDAKGKTHVEDVGEDADMEAGPELPPDEDEPQDDEEGRFFGGGVSRDTADVLDFMDEQDKDEPLDEKIDQSWLRRQTMSFEKRISKNQELRAKFESDPRKFVGSEADLDADIRGFSILSEHPELYEDCANLGVAGQLVSLLAHDNTDIAIDAMEIISELLDEDVEAEQDQWDVLVEALLEADLPDLLVQNLSRLDETNDSDRNGVYYSLSVLESLASQTGIAEKVAENVAILKWLLGRAQAQESKVSQNKQYSVEVLAIFLQTSTKIRSSVLALDTVDTLLQLLAPYRKNDPEKDSDDEEYVENLFDCLTCLIEAENGRHKFIEAEGVELALIMLREGKFSKQRALRTLDHAMGGLYGTQICEKVVELAGLKTIFGIFMKRMEHATAEHVLGIFASMLRLLPAESGPRIRLLAKFLEKDHEKIRKLVKLRRDYAQRLVPVDNGIRAERATLADADIEAMADEFLSRRLDAGSYSLQTVDMILAWLIAEDSGARRTATAVLAEKDEGLDVIKATLTEQLQGLQSVEGGNAQEQADATDMLKTLVDCLSQPGWT